MRGSTVDIDGIPLVSPAIRPAFKVWLETDEGHVFGPGVYDLLRKVEETGTLKEAAQAIGMSYRYAWGLVKKAEEKLGQPLLKAHKGGRAGGGGAELTEVGRQFLEEFSRIEAVVSRLSREGWQLGGFGARNRVDGVITDLKMIGERADITLRLSESAHLRLNIPQKSISERGITEGDHLNVELICVAGSLKKRAEPGSPLF
jgi:molybdate transport system regulatory protein